MLCGRRPRISKMHISWSFEPLDEGVGKTWLEKLSISAWSGIAALLS
jgi:hypothetical protein